MIKNGKFYLSPPHDGSDFKELFRRLSAAGAGRPVDKEGFPMGPWTPELLATAISQIDANRSGIELRTIQLWYQDNLKGISIENIRWLARVFGCDDPRATSEWQAELRLAQSRLVTARRRLHSGSEHRATQGSPVVAGRSPFSSETKPPVEMAHNTQLVVPKRRLGLARASEAVFSRGSPLDLPAAVFAGAVALGFSSYFLDIYSIVYEQESGLTKQVGFLWAPNWTLLFMVLMPLYFAFVGELVVFWKNARQTKPSPKRDRVEDENGWMRKVEASSITHWASFLICLPIAALLQWVDRCLGPLLAGDPGNYAVEWARIAIVRPEIISIPEAIVFTALAYLYMGVSFFLFFVGLILLCTLANDFWEIGQRFEFWSQGDYRCQAYEISLTIMNGVFRCSILGLLIAICMKLQSAFMLSRGATIVSWLKSDLLSVFTDHETMRDWLEYNMPTNYSSLLIVLATCAVFVYASIRTHAVVARLSSAIAAPKKNGTGPSGLVASRFRGSLVIMSAIISLLITSYLLIGAFAGFSILLSLGLLFAGYGLFDPRFGTGQVPDLGGNKSVP
ncbi:RcgA family putative transporter (plasmid) [Aquicoccus sp. G2-2]|uniref:RcgA family putative transporter n=1 Tax=Aquicoccus sp. G2-2 TaxID=3092120 RepID=UPI00366B065B